MQSRTGAFERALSCKFVKGPLLKCNKKINMCIYIHMLHAGTQEYELEAPHCYGNIAHRQVQLCQYIYTHVCYIYFPTTSWRYNKLVWADKLRTTLIVLDHSVTYDRTAISLHRYKLAWFISVQTVQNTSNSPKLKAFHQQLIAYQTAPSHKVLLVGNKVVA